MNDILYNKAKSLIDNMTSEELKQLLTEYGVDYTTEIEHESEFTLYDEDITGIWKYSVGDIVCNPNGINMPKFKITGYVYYNGKSYYALNDIDQWNNYCDVPKLQLETKWKLWNITA